MKILFQLEKINHMSLKKIINFINDPRKVSRLYADAKFSNIEKNIYVRNIVWHFTTPKCASTYFSKYIDHIIQKNKRSNNVGIIRAVPEFGERPQSVCKYHINEHLKFRKNNFLFITYRQHTQATNDLLKIINSKKHMILIQYRNILDTLASLIDYWDEIPSSIWSSVTPNYWQGLNKDQKFEVLMQLYLPWHIQFLQSWNLYKNENIVFCNYNEIIKNPYKYINLIFNKYNIKVNDYDFNKNKKEINFNKGYSRFNEYFSKDQINQVRRFVEKFDYLNQDLVKYL